jgi:hypothetical protein
METSSGMLHEYEICGSRLCLSKRSWRDFRLGIAAPANLFSATFDLPIFPRARYIEIVVASSLMSTYRHAVNDEQSDDAATGHQKSIRASDFSCGPICCKFTYI